MKLQEILNKYKNSIRDGDFERIEIDKVSLEIYDTVIIDCWIDGEPTSMSIRDLLSPESGFMQAMFGEQWCHLYNPDYYTDNNNNGFEELYDLVGGMRSLPRRKYHAMRCSILTDEEVVKYLEENVE